MLYQIHVISAGSQTSLSKAALPYIKKKYDIKEQLNKFIPHTLPKSLVKTLDNNIIDYTSSFNSLSAKQAIQTFISH